MTGIIDIGSNTIRLVIYDKKKRISNYGLTSEIFNDTVDGNLSSSGIVKLCCVIEFLKEKAQGCEIFAFATFAFRVLKNCEEVKNEVFKRTGIEIDILSGEEEAEYDFYGLMSSLSKGESGIGIDLGGGSAQIFSFSNGVLKYYDSYPIGCRKLKNKFVKDNVPDITEREGLEKYIKEKLLSFNGKSKKIYMMGGTAKTAAKLYSFLNGSENIDILKTENLEGIIRFIKETPENVMKNVLKKRYDNIAVGIFIMKIIAEVLGAEKIHIKKCGVRDGYLIKKEQEKSISKC